MNKKFWDQMAAGAGLVSVFLFFGGWLIYGNGPTVSDSPASILEFFSNNHDRVILSMFVQGVGTLAMIWFMAALIIAIHDVNEQLLAVATGLAFAVALALGSAATIMRSGLAFISVGDISPDTVTIIFYLGSVIDTGQNIISAGFFLTVALAIFRTGFIPVWWGWASIAGALWAVASTTALNHVGFWSPHKAGFLNLVSYFVWIGGTSILLTRKMRKETS